MTQFSANGRFHVEIHTKHCQIPADIRTRIQPHLERVGSAVQDFPLSELALTIVHHPRSDVYHAQAKLKVPGKMIATGNRHQQLDPAILHCLEKVLLRVADYKTHPDQEAMKRAEAKANLANAIIAPVEPDAGRLGTAVTSGDYPAFRRNLLNQEERLRKRIGRWIQRYPEMEVFIGKTVAIADLVEELFLLAFEQYRHRPTSLSLHEWLDGLIDPAVKSFWHDPDDRLAVHYAQTLTELER